MLKQFTRTAIALTVGLVSLGGLAAVAQASESDYNRLSFEVSASESVANDEINARLSKTLQARDAKTLATQMNTIINHALSLKSKYPEVTLTSGSQHSYPTHDKNGKITGYTATASVLLKSQNSEQIGQFIADLQTNLVLDGLDFSVSDTLQKQVQDRLKAEAIKEFSDEAKSLASLWGARDYRLVNANLNAGRQAKYGSPMDMSARMVDAEGIAAPTFEAGESEIRYHINGTIELVK